MEDGTKVQNKIMTSRDLYSAAIQHTGQTPNIQAWYVHNKSLSTLFQPIPGNFIVSQMS